MQSNQIWDPEHECMPREELEQLQLERLQATLEPCLQKCNLLSYQI